MRPLVIAALFLSARAHADPGVEPGPVLAGLQSQAAGTLSAPPAASARIVGEAPTPAKAAKSPATLLKPGDWPAYLRWLDANAGTQSAGRNAIAFLVDKQAEGPGLAAVASAVSSIHIEVFQYQADRVGWALAKILAAKAAGGVHVRLLLDGCGTNEKDPETAKLIAYLRQDRAQVIVRKPPFLDTHIDHRKLMAIDGRIAFVGGMNIGATYQEDWHDQQSMIRGPAVAKIQEAFVNQWKALGGTIGADEELFPAEPGVPDGYETRVVTHRGGNRDQNIKLAYLGAFATAERLIRIADPYFVDPDVINALMAAARRHVTVQVLLPARNNKKIVLHASRAFYPDMIKAGIEVYEYQDRMAHDKVAAIDGYWATFGSSNLDARSLKFNDELNLVVTDARFAAGVDGALFEADLKQSRRITSYRPTLAEKAERALLVTELSSRDGQL